LKKTRQAELNDTKLL